MTRLLVALVLAFLVPATVGAQLDHLKCYKVKDSTPKKAYTADLTPGNPAFTAETGCLVKVPAKMLCIDVTKSNVVPQPTGAPPGPPAGTFLCYKLKCRGATPSLSLTDQFGTHPILVGSAKMLCAPVPGPTTTTTTLPPPVCGNGVIEPGETCDDGNTVSNDGCDSNCQTEPFYCGDGHCTMGETCSNCPVDCGGCAVCGNGVIDPGEQCDDGNTAPGDGCSATCQFECIGQACNQNTDCCSNHCMANVCVP